MSHTKDKWIIIFLIYADFRQNVEFKEAFAMTEQMKATLDSMLKDILTVPLDPKRARMYVIMNSIDYKETASSKTEAKTLFYEVGNPCYLKYNQITACRVLRTDPGTPDTPDLGNPVQKPDTLKKILYHNILVKKDEEVFFITWDHGSAFGIFREVDPGKAEILQPIHHNLDRYPYLKEFWNKALQEDSELKKSVDQGSHSNRPNIIKIGHTFFRLKIIPAEQNFLDNSGLITQRILTVRRKDTLSDGSKLFLVYNEKINEFEVSNGKPVKGRKDKKKAVGELSAEKVREILSNDELAIVFREWLGAEKKVGVLLMMNCWMMNLHTMYSLVNTVQCLVAPQSDIGTPGYNYKAILKYLLKDKHALSISPQQLAICCVKTIETKRMRKLSKKLRHDRSDIIDTWKVFAFDLQTQDLDGNRLLLNQIEALSSLIDVMNRAVSSPAFSCEASYMFKYIRSVCFDFSQRDAMMIDIINWSLSLLYADGFFLRDGKSKLYGVGIRKGLENFIDQVFRRKKFPSLNLCSTEGELVYLVSKDVFQPTSVIDIEPKGYSIFFPIFEIHSKGLHEALLDNVKKDRLLSHLKNWKEFLRIHIDADIDY